MDKELLDAIRAVIREEMEPMKQDIDGMKQDIGGMKEDIASLKTGQRLLTEKVDYLAVVVDEALTLHDDLEGRVKALEAQAI